jgi:hypothetical protein
VRDTDRIRGELEAAVRKVADLETALVSSTETINRLRRELNERSEAGAGTAKPARGRQATETQGS